MIIQEAIKSGKPFRRAHWDQGAQLYVKSQFGTTIFKWHGLPKQVDKFLDPSKGVELAAEAVLADDWELVE